MSEDRWNDAIEAAAKIADDQATCGCGNPGCGVDGFAARIAAAIRTLKTDPQGG